MPTAENGMRWRLRQTVRQLPVGLWGGFLWVQWQNPDDPADWQPADMPDGAQPSVVERNEQRCRRRTTGHYGPRLAQLKRSG